MKIIGMTGKPYSNHFIVDIGEGEVQNLLGHYSSYSHGKTLRVGDEIKVSEMYQRLSKMKTNEADLEKAAALLRASAELLEKALPGIHRANEDKEEGDDE